MLFRSTPIAIDWASPIPAEGEWQPPQVLSECRPPETSNQSSRPRLASVGLIGRPSRAVKLDPTVPVMTMTSYIVQVSLGDTPYGSLSYLTIFAVGTTLFVMTFAMNVVSHWVVRRFREVYD